jgi:hypothetical protein
MCWMQSARPINRLDVELAFFARSALVMRKMGCAYESRP